MSATDSSTPDYSSLTQEEIEAINADPSEDELVTMRQAQEAEDLDDDIDESQYEDDEKPAAKAKEAKQKESQDDDVVEIETKQQNQVPRYDAKLPEDYEQKLTDLRSKKAEIKEAYQNGDIDFDEYDSQIDEINDGISDLKSAKTKAEISQEFNAQTVEQQWQSTVAEFTADIAKSEGIDYRKDIDKQADMDLFLMALSKKPEFQDKPPRWFLEQAHEKVKALHGIESAPKKTDPKQTLKDAKDKRKAPIDKLPQTLANVPGGDDASESEGKFADLDKMDGLDLEMQLAKMSPEARDQYLRGA